MIKEMKKMIKAKINQIGFNFDGSKMFEKEMIRISLDEDDRIYPTYDCIYYPSCQRDGILKFKLRFSIDNQIVGIQYLDEAPELHIIL